MWGMQRARRDAEFTEFYDARVRQLRRIAFTIVRDWHAAEDVTQRACVSIYRAWPRIRPEGLEAYARRVLVNESLSHLRRSRELVVPAVPEAAVDVPETLLDLDAAMAALPPQQRAVIALRFVDDRSVAETAAALGIAEGSVKSHTSKALATLRRRVAELIHHD